MLGRGVLLKLIARNVVIRQQQPVGAHERARAAVVQSHARKPQMVQPLLRWGEIVFFLELLYRGIIKRPHPFVGSNRGAEKRGRHHRSGGLTNYDCKFHEWVSSILRGLKPWSTAS